MPLTSSPRVLGLCTKRHEQHSLLGLLAPSLPVPLAELTRRSSLRYVFPGVDGWRSGIPPQEETTRYVRSELTIDNVLTSPQTVSLQAEITARGLIEAVFVQLQSDDVYDPFSFTIDYFGYDYYQGVTTYLGYNIVSIGQYVSNAQNYWALFINGAPASTGIDSYFVQPGDQLELKWLAASAAGHSASARAQRVTERRAKRA